MANDAETKPSRSVQSPSVQLRLALPRPRRPSVIILDRGKQPSHPQYELKCLWHH